MITNRQDTKSEVIARFAQHVSSGKADFFAAISEQDLGGRIEASYANAVALYVSYAVTDKQTLYGRGEYASSDTSVLGASKVFATTATVQYDLWANVLSRLEFRWDHAADGSTPYGNITASGTGDRKNYFILLANLDYKF